MYKPLTAEKLFIRIIAAALLLLVIMAVATFIGGQRLSISNIIHPSAAVDGVTDYQIYVHVRVPRVLLAAIVGAALACAGVVFQALLRNPLADPYILGISSGAGLGAIIAVISGLQWTLLGRSPIAMFAFIGAIGTVWLVWLIGGFTGKTHVTGLLLAGVVVNAFFSALIMFLTSIAKSDQVFATIFWLMGNISEEDFLVLWLSAGFIVAGLIGLFFISPHLNAISFGETDAKSLGINTTAIRFIAFVLAAMITAVSVSLSGLIGFVGLITPHAVRLVCGPDHRQLLPISAAAGAAFLVIADTIARFVVIPAQLPVGVITAIIGGPVFLILLLKYTRKISWLSGK